MGSWNQPNNSSKLDSTDSIFGGKDSSNFGGKDSSIFGGKDSSETTNTSSSGNMYGSSKVLSPPVSPEIKVSIRSVFFSPNIYVVRV